MLKPGYLQKDNNNADEKRGLYGHYGVAYISISDPENVYQARRYFTQSGAGTW